MQKLPRDDLAILDAVAGLTADIMDAPDKADVKRLRILAASALRLQQKDKVKHLKPAQPITRLLPLDYDDDVREAMRTQLLEAESIYEEKVQVLEVHRRDARDLLLEGRLVDSLSGLSPSERLGPFIVNGGAEIWFDIFFAARRLVVIEAGASTPALVLTKARPPVVGSSSTTIDIEPGTVWVRGDFIDGSLPAGAFVGVKVSGGLVELTGSVTVNGDTVEVSSSLHGKLQLELAKDTEAPAVERRLSSGTKVNLPKSLLLKFGPGSTQAKGATGKAQAWGQTFKFTESTNSWSFVDSLWTVILEYKIEPKKLNTNPISNDLVDFEGTASIKRAGLGLPVVVPTNPAILGEVANSPGWWLFVKNFTARWYEPDPRFHVINNAWVGISNRGTVICAQNVQPISPPVTHVYKLWSIADGGGQRVPWRQTYEQNFVLVYRFDVVQGEHFLVSGQSTVALDRPVQTNGVPIATPTTQGALLLHRLSSGITITIGAVVSQDGVMQQLSLRNALVWTTRPVVIFVHGKLKQPQYINAGNTQLLFGVYAWAPILPDPYVTNFHIRRPDIKRSSHARTLLVAKISWRSPEDISVSFQGQFGPPFALAGKGKSPGDPRPAPAHQEGPDIGLTQVGQNELSLDEETAAQWSRARGLEFKKRAARVKLAQDQNEKSQQTIDGLLTEALGPAPQVLLLDVSTNQDLLGVALGYQAHVHKPTHGYVSTLSTGAFPVARLEVHSQVANIRVVTLPQVQWEPVRTLDPDQDIIALGWFPTPLASATDGGATQLGAYSQRLVPSIPEDALRGTYDAFSDGTQVVFRTTLPFGLVTVVQLQPEEVGTRPSDLYKLTQPKFPSEDSVGGLHITALAEGGRPDLGGVSPMFIGQMCQLINGVDLSSGTPLGLSVLGSTADPAGSVETVFNNDMMANPKVPVTRFDLSGYGGSNFSEWNNPFAAFSEAAKVQFHVMVGRTALEVIKVNSVLHPWGIRVTRSITVERRPGGGVIRRDSGWQAFTPGIFDYRYFDETTNAIEVAPYTFDAGVFQGLFGVHSIRPAPGSEFSFGGATMVPYYFDAELALEGLADRTQAIGILGYLQTKPNGVPASAAALQNLLETQGPIGGPIDAWIDFGGSGLPFRARRVEIGLALDGANPIFVATVRGVPRLPQTGAWSVVTRPVASVPPGGGEAVPVPDNRGVPLIRRYPIRYVAGDTKVYSAPPLDGPPSTAGDYRFADAADLLNPSAPDHDYALLQSTPTHAFLFPRPYVPSSSPSRIHSDVKAALADVISRSTSKSAFPPKQNTIELAAGSLYFDVGTDGTLALSSPISIVNHPTPLRIAGSDGHGSTLYYDDATLLLELHADRWNAEFTGLRIWTDICGLERLTGSELRVVGSTNQRPQIAELKSLILQEIEEILQYIPLFGARGIQGPIDLGASNAKHEFKLEVKEKVTIPPNTVSVPVGPVLKLKLYLKQSTGFDLESGGVKASATFGAELEGRIPVYSFAVVKVFLVVSFKIEFSLVSVTGTVTSEKLDLVAFVGIGVEGRIATFKAYAFLGIGFVLSYSIIEDITKYGGLVALEAGLDLRIVNIKLRAELQGLIYDDAGTTKCDYSGKVKIQVDIFLIISISATYQITETATM
jgi:hypothetical protein